MIVIIEVNQCKPQAVIQPRNFCRYGCGYLTPEMVRRGKMFQEARNDKHAEEYSAMLS